MGKDSKKETKKKEKKISPSKIPAPAPKISGKQAADKKVKHKSVWKSQHPWLFEKKKRNFGIGQDLRPRTSTLSRMMKWPRYIRVQRQRAILKQRLKIPPAIFQFTKTLDRNIASNLFRLLSHYRPETREEKTERLLTEAKTLVKAEDAEKKKKKEKEEKKEEKKEKGKTRKGKEEAEIKKKSRPMFVKHGLNFITNLILAKKAKLVIIAHDVEPIELVVWLPALCRKMNVPYCIVKGKARLGQFVHRKKTAALAITEMRKEDQSKFDQIIDSVKVLFNDNVASTKTWGGGLLGLKSQHRLKKKEAARAASGIVGKAHGSAPAAAPAVVP